MKVCSERISFDAKQYKLYKHIAFIYHKTLIIIRGNQMTNKLGRNILIIFLLSLSFGKLTHSDIYDDRVVAREADKQLQNYDSMKMQNAYDKYNQISSANNSNFTNAEVIGGTIIFLIFWLPLAYLVFVKPKKKNKKSSCKLKKSDLLKKRYSIKLRFWVGMKFKKPVNVQNVMKL